MADKISNADFYMNKWGLAFMRNVTDSETLDTVNPFLKKIEEILTVFDSAREEITRGQKSIDWTPYVLGKVESLRAQTALKLKPVTESAIVLADEKSKVISQIQNNIFWNGSGAMANVDENRMREVRDYYHTRPQAEALKALNGPDVFQFTALVKSPVPFFPENPDFITRAVEQKLGPLAVAYRQNMIESIETIKTWLRRAHTYIGAPQDSRIELISL